MTFVYHAAGIADSGGSSYVDSVIMRETDTNFAWADASDDVLNIRTLYVQNWRSDVMAILDSDGNPLERVRYTAYGTPSSHPIADINGDGAVNSTDQTQWAALLAGGTNSAVYAQTDLNADGLFPDTTDEDFFAAQYARVGGGSVFGINKLSSVSSRKGYAGYEWDLSITSWHVRHRVLDSASGKIASMGPSPRLSHYALRISATQLIAIGGVKCLHSGGCNTGDSRAESPVNSIDHYTDAIEQYLRQYCQHLEEYHPDPAFGQRCRACSDGAANFARARGIRPGDQCFENVMLAYMKRCTDGPDHNGRDHIDHALEQLSKCRSIEPNGCGAKGGTNFPDFQFGNCCDEHDMCYGRCGALKSDCDREFLECMQAVCSEVKGWVFRQICNFVADSYYLAVSYRGEEAYRQAQRRNCS